MPIYIEVNRSAANRALSKLHVNMARKSLTQSRLLLVLGLVTLVLGTREPSMVRFENNGYKDLLVAISPSVDASQSEDLLKNIKVYDILFRANVNVVFFLTIPIIYTVLILSACT